MAEALGAAASTEEGRFLRVGWLEFMNRWGDTHYLYGDASVPCSLEHLRPTDGVRFRNVIDYFHSAWSDPFLLYWAGIRVHDEGTIQFAPFTDEDFLLENVPVQGRELTFSRCGGHLQVWDEHRCLIAESRTERLSFALPGK